MLQSMPQSPALILGVCCREGQTIPSPGSQKAAWPHLAPSVWLERQRSANQSHFSCDTCVSKSGSATSPALCPGQHWGTQSMFPPPSLSPTLMTLLPDVSQQDISLMIFFLISTKHPQAKLSHQFPNLWHHPEGANHEVLQALLQHWHLEEEEFLGTRHQVQLTPQQNHSAEQSTSPAASRL